jgi:superfamily I DNA and/or RNA helicase
MLLLFFAKICLFGRQRIQIQLELEVVHHVMIYGIPRRS